MLGAWVKVMFIGPHVSMVVSKSVWSEVLVRYGPHGSPAPRWDVGFCLIEIRLSVVLVEDPLRGMAASSGADVWLSETGA